jgi:dephospho-CoA kinase
VRALRIGLTGPIGCGKSTIGRWLTEESGGVLVDADAVAREVTAPGSPAHDEILRKFGPAVHGREGSLDRASLARIVFGDPERLQELEAIVHPAVRPLIVQRIEAAEAAGARLVVVEAIKLVEGGLAELCDEVWLVRCDPQAQRDRLTGRGSEPDDAARRVVAQAGVEARLTPAATRIIDTSGPIEATQAAVRSRLSEAQSGFRG